MSKKYQHKMCLGGNDDNIVRQADDTELSVKWLSHVMNYSFLIYSYCAYIYVLNHI